MTFLDAAHDLRPRLDIIGGLVEIGAKIVELVARCRQIEAAFLLRMRFDAVDLCPLGQIGRRGLVPALAAVARDVDKSIVAAGPQYSLLVRRLQSRENRAV